MIQTRMEARAASRVRAPLLALFLITATACDSADRLASTDSKDSSDATVSFAAGGRSGIPFGLFALPPSVYGSTYTGGHHNPGDPGLLLSNLATIHAAGGKVALALAGAPPQYVNADGTFNFDLWKARVSRYSTIDFSSYISDGTVLGNFLIDQPNCSTCWGGQSIPQETVEAMAQYSKSLWPDMTTIARAETTWLAESTAPYAYLDAGWAQYVARKGDVNTFLADNVAAARSEGLGLIVGLNVLRGNVDQSSLTATQVKDLGSVLLANSYACAFISWQYDASYLALPDIKAAMELLSKKAKRHASTSCRQ
ncbi:MAG: hypothetical protein ACJ8DC_12895 [Gemmatimonadales bacterium]